MVLKLVAIAALVIIGLTLTSAAPATTAQPVANSSTWPLLIAFGAALIPAQFAYGGWQTACFVAGEVRDPQKTLPRGLLLGVLGVIVVYLSVNYVSVHVLGADGLAQTKTPASSVMRLALGDKGGRLIAAGIAISTIGFLSQSMLTAPRVYFAMAEDKLFFRQLASLNKARVPAVAIALQGVLAIIIALAATRFEKILNYVVSVDVVFFALSAACVFVFRRRSRNPGVSEGARPAKDTLPNGRVSASEFFRIPGHPFTTLFFIAACCVITFSVIYHDRFGSAISFGIMLLGIPAYFVWAKKSVPPA
jgi:APA family basic amino acid/polyamine antiporter